MGKANFKLTKVEGQARRAEFNTPHGMIQTPCFMNVATCAAIKGGVSATDLEEVHCQVMLSNTYHLHLRPGDSLIHDLGGLQKFTTWQGPTLTDCGGFQLFSLAPLRKITEEGCMFSSHIDGRKIFMGPEESMQIQSNLASTIAMAFDECVANPAEYSYAKESCKRTTRWFKRSIAEMDRLNQLDSTINKEQLLFGINQGATFSDLRIEHMKEIAELDMDGYAIGGLAVGEPTEVMYDIIEKVIPFMPKDRPRYLMGVGTPSNILNAVERGVDMFDCVMPTRLARHGVALTPDGPMHIKNKRWENDSKPIDPEGHPHVNRFSRAAIRHFFRAGEMLALRLLSFQNLHFYLRLMAQARSAIAAGEFAAFKRSAIARYQANEIPS